MHAIIRQGNGKYYISAVFGHYVDITATDDYEQYLQSIHNRFWVIWNKDKTRLIKYHNMTPNTKYLIPQVLVVDSKRDDWNIDDDGTGCVNFLTREMIDSFIDLEEQPNDILEKCRNVDANYTYNEVQEVITKQDIENLIWVSGDFHDASIKEEKLLEDGSLYVRFGDVWGCEIEVWFWGDLEYDTSPAHDADSLHYFYGSSIIQQDGFIYLVDEEDMKVEDIKEGYCYFKARHMKYRVVPD